MVTRSPETLIELGDVSADGGLPVAIPPARRTIRTAAVLLSALLCAATLTSSAVPQSHGPRLSWTLASERDARFILTDGSLIVHPSLGSPATGPADAGPTAYDLADGSPLWSVAMPDGDFQGAWPADDALVMPIDGNADVGGLRNDGTLVRSTAAVDIATGAWRWRIPGYVSVTAPGLGIVEVADDRTGRTTGLQAIRLTDGSTVARGRLDRRTAAPDGTSSTMVQIDGDALHVSEDSGDRQVVTAYDLDTLRRRWRIERPAGGTLVPCGTVVCIVEFAGTVAYDRATGAVRWRADGWINPWPIGPGRLLFSNGQAPAGHATVDAGTGAILADHGPGETVGTTPESMYYLRYTQEPASRVSVSRLDPHTGRTRLLGTIGLVFTEQCQANATRLVCPRTDGTLTVTDVS